jgi:hypothetical protein
MHDYEVFMGIVDTCKNRQAKFRKDGLGIWCD